MELRGLLIGLIMGGVWIYSGIILSLVKNKSYIYDKSYHISKRYMVMFLIFSGLVAIVSTVHEGLLGKELEFLGIFSLICSFVAAILLLLSIMSLFNHEGCTGRRLWQCFFPVLILFALYFVSKLIFAEPRVYSIIELLRCIHLSPPVCIRFLIELFIIVGVSAVVCKYLKHKKLCLSNVSDFPLPVEYERIMWIDRLLLFMILIGGLSVLDSVIMEEGYSFINDIVGTGVVVYYVISFVNYQPSSIPVQASQEEIDTHDAVGFSEEYIIENQVEDVMPSIEGVEENAANTVQEGKCGSLEEIDESYYYTKRAVDKWISRSDKPYLKAGITLKDAALGVGVSRRKLSDFIKSEYDCNFNTWINRQRIEEVKRYLLEEDTNLSLSYIADSTGFADLAGMSNTFKKIMGIPPSIYRKEIVTKAINEELVTESE